MAMGENVKHDGTQDMASIGATMRREDVEAFRQIAEQRGETVGSMLRRFVQKTIREAAQGA